MTETQKPRKFIHVDMDAFYASVEIREQPWLADKPIAIGGRAGGRGVLSTCNYIARQYGLHSAMPTHQALKLCPDVVLLPGQMSLYKEISQQVQAIFRRYTDLVEPLSLDEAYLDVTDSDLHQGSATRIAQAIRNDIFKETQLTASAGVAPLKYLAKIASELDKPNGLSVIAPEQVEQFISELELRKISGVGKVSAQRLSEHGYVYGRDILASNSEQLRLELGKLGEMLWRRCNALDSGRVSTHRVRKSVGVERTFAKDIGDSQLLGEKLIGLLPELKRRSDKVLAGEASIKTIGVKIKFSDFQQTTHDQQAQQIDEQVLMDLFSQAMLRGNGKAVRLVGLHIGLEYSKQRQEQMHLPLS
ncbi:DNA polymerase IV [Alginatibacterium sediminis]|uniref:DNA polymerase IV n=1 Tax=Alginatibacterium sediminis TaxID=2164068 RepID=A0A420E8N3_9ALTE|nr:DNA polymerase IV [Alginatibacterium sediminis]RKF15761.1 DNA polymerase IV [Alginatibacterium sediminis]